MKNLEKFYLEIVKSNKPNNYQVIEKNYFESKEMALDDWIPYEGMKNTFVACLRKNSLISYIHFFKPVRIRLSKFNSIARGLTPQSTVQYS